MKNKVLLVSAFFMVKTFTLVLTDLMTEKIDPVNHHFVVKYPLSFLIIDTDYEHSRHYRANAQTHWTAKTT